MPQYSSAAGAAEGDRAEERRRRSRAIEYAGAEPATPMITESKSPRTPAFRLCSGVSNAGISGRLCHGIPFSFGIALFNRGSAEM